MLQLRYNVVFFVEEAVLSSNHGESMQRESARGTRQCDAIDRSRLKELRQKRGRDMCILYHRSPEEERTSGFT